MKKIDEKVEVHNDVPKPSKLSQIIQAVAGIFLVYIGTSADEPLRTVMLLLGLVVTILAIARDYVIIKWRRDEKKIMGVLFPQGVKPLHLTIIVVFVALMMVVTDFLKSVLSIRFDDPNTPVIIIAIVIISIAGVFIYMIKQFVKTK